MTALAVSPLLAFIDYLYSNSLKIVLLPGSGDVAVAKEKLSPHQGALNFQKAVHKDVILGEPKKTMKVKRIGFVVENERPFVNDICEWEWFLWSESIAIVAQQELVEKYAHLKIQSDIKSLNAYVD